MSKTNDTGGTAAAGQTVVYTIDVNSAANGPQTVITDGPLDANLVFDTTSATTPDKCTYDSGTRIVTCNLQGIGNGDNFVTITVHVDPAAPKDAVITNCTDWQSGNYNTTLDSVLHACDGDGFTVVVQADMQVVKTQTDPLPASNPVPGLTDVTYHIEATNNGPSAAAGVTVGDSLTSGAALYEGIANVSTGLDCSSNTNVVGSAFVTFTCTATGTGDPLANGSSLSFDLTLRMPNDGTTSITNQGSTSTTTDDPDGTNDTSSVTTTICQSVDLAITKVCSALCTPPPADIRASSIHEDTVTLPFCPSPITEIQGGSNFEYLITVTNNDASVNATNVILNDPLPAGVSFVSVSPNPCVSGAISTNDCNLGTINAGGSVSFAITVTAVQSGPVDNSASVSTLDFCERTANDNTADCQVTVNTNNMPTALEADREGCTNVSSPFCTGDPDSVATDSDVNRVIEPNELVRVDPAWTNTLDNDTLSDITGSTPTSGAGSYGFSDTTANGVTYEVLDPTADYGTITAHTQSDCNSATGDCYEFRANMPGSRPVQHWDTHFTETLSSGETKQWTLHIGDSFTDMARTNTFYRFVETIYHNGITVGGGAGCTSAQYCPGQNTRRDQLTAFVSRSLLDGTDSNVPVSGSGYDCSDLGNLAATHFSDTPPGSTFCRHANFLFVNNIVFGCSPGVLCAANPTTRGQMAAVIARALQFQAGHTANPDSFVPDAGTDGSTRTYDCTSGPGPFSDVLVGNAFCKYIGDLWVRHIVDGFQDGTFRPGTSIRRDESAKILANAFVNVPLYGPLPGLGL